MTVNQMNMTAQELKALFASCNLDIQHLSQGQIARYKDQQPEMVDVVVFSESKDRRMLLSAIRKALKNHLRKIKNKTRQAYTYGGSFWTTEGKHYLSVSVAIALKD